MSVRIPPASSDSLSFESSRALLNPKFETYQLQLNANSSNSYALPKSIKLPTLPDHARLSFAEVQARVHHNHLAIGKGGEAIYLNQDYELIGIELRDRVPRFHSLLNLPIPISKNLLEYPVCISIDLDRWAVSDGNGLIYIISIQKESEKWEGTVKNVFELEEVASSGLPFRLHAVNLLDSGDIIALLSTTQKEPATSTAKSITTFDYRSVIFPPSTSATIITPLTIQWKLQSTSLPYFVTYLPESQRYIIGSSSPLFQSLPTAPITSLPVQSVNVDGSESTPRSVITPTIEKEKPPPFSWTQDKESLTLVFAVPSDTPTSSIRATFSRQFLSIIIGSANSVLSNAVNPVDLPRVNHKKLWDVIDPHTSVWTFDRDAEGRDSTFGLLSLHLEKGNIGTRWLEVFASSPQPLEGGLRDLGTADRLLEGIEETLDSNELANISELMEKWTTAGEGEILEREEGNEQPTSLMGMEIDVEIDGDSGRSLVITWIEEVFSSNPRLVRPHASIPYSLLSTALPQGLVEVDPSIVIKHDVDGTIFFPPSLPSTYNWTHSATFPALAFVLATKRDTNFVYHLSNKAVFAFDSPSSAKIGPTGKNGAGNLFIYYNTQGPKDAKGKQKVLRIGGTGSGTLMGVGGIVLKEATILLALCEKELVIFEI